MDEITIAVVVITLFLALAFDLINGFHDAANSIATVVSTRVLSPRFAVLWAAFFNFVAILIFAPKVADTISKIVNVAPGEVAFIYVVCAGLLGAIIWNLLTWIWGLPSSSSHALLGGLAAGIIISMGKENINWFKLLNIFAILFLSPLVAFMAGTAVARALRSLFYNASLHSTNHKFRRLQIIASGLASFAHGSNDAQKSMGIITMALVSGGLLEDFTIPLEVKIVCAGAIALGTVSGGWRIVRTVGQQIFSIRPATGFAADLSAAMVIYSSSLAGFPVSTTHVVASAVIGAGTAQRIKGVRWKAALKILAAWYITMPTAALMASIILLVIRSTLL